MAEPMSDEWLAEVHTAVGHGSPIDPRIVADLLAEVGQLNAGLQRLRDERDEALQARNNGRVERDRLRADRDLLAEQVKRVREVHPRELDAQGRPVCGSCRDAREEPHAWPCPTMAALDGEEAPQ